MCHPLGTLVSSPTRKLNKLWCSEFLLGFHYVGMIDCHHCPHDWAQSPVPLPFWKMSGWYHMAQRPSLLITWWIFPTWPAPRLESIWGSFNSGTLTLVSFQLKTWDASCRSLNLFVALSFQVLWPANSSCLGFPEFFTFSSQHRETSELCLCSPSLHCILRTFLRHMLPALQCLKSIVLCICSVWYLFKMGE